MEHPDVIEVATSKQIEVEADRVDVFVTMRGSSLVTGQSALNKAREVAQLVAELKEFGLDEAQIKLQSVHAETQSGMLGKTSSAMYALKIDGVAVDQLPEILGIVTAQKNATLNSLSWRYPDDDAARDALLDACLERTNAKARRIATQLGVQLLGVYEMNETTNRNDRPWQVGASQSEEMDMLPSMPRARVSSQELGLAVSHSKTIEVGVTVKYRVSAFDSSN